MLPDTSANQIVDNILQWLAKSSGALARRSAALGLLKVLPHTTDKQKEVYVTSITEVMQRCHFKDKQVITKIWLGIVKVHCVIDVFSTANQSNVIRSF